MKKQNTFFYRGVKGFIIGVAAILPGASGGVLAVAMGIYRPVLEAVTGIFKAFWKSMRFLFPLGLGAMLGILSISRLVEYLMVNFKEPTMFALIGLVLGGVPSFLREANARGFKKRYLFACALGVSFIAAFAYFNARMTDGSVWPFNAWTSALSGGIIAAGSVIPGISTSFLLIHMGLYEPLLAAFNSFDIPMLFFAGTGAVVVAGALVFFVKKLFDKAYGYAYYAVFGFLMASVALIFPGITWGLMMLLDASLLALSAFITYILCGKPSGA